MGGLLSIALGISLAAAGPDGVSVVVAVDAATPASARPRAEGVTGYLEDRLATWKHPLVQSPHRFRVVVLGRGDKRVELRLMGETALIAAREVAPSDPLLLRATAWSFVRSAIRRTLIDRGALPKDAPDEGPDLTPAIPASTRAEPAARSELVAVRTPAGAAIGGAAARAGALLAATPAATASGPAGSAPASSASATSPSISLPPASANAGTSGAASPATAGTSAAALSVSPAAASPAPAASASPAPAPPTAHAATALEVEPPAEADAARALALLERQDAPDEGFARASRPEPSPRADVGVIAAPTGVEVAASEAPASPAFAGALSPAWSMAVLGAGDYAGDLSFGPRLRLRFEPLAHLSVAIEGGWSRSLSGSELRLDSVPLAAAVGLVFGREIELGLAAQAQVVLHFASAASGAQTSTGLDLGLVATLSVPLTARLSWAIRAFGGAAARRQNYLLDSGAKDLGILAASVATGLEWRWR